MIWIPNKYQLQYYNNCKGIPCYCEALVRTDDLVLQGNFPKGNGDYGIKIYVTAPEGDPAYEDATSYFEYFFAYNPYNGRDYFSLRLLRWSPAMCAHNCGFLLRVLVYQNDSPDTPIFLNWTEQYCIADCCDTASGITITQSGVGVLLSTDTTSSLNGKTSHCNDPLVTIFSYNNCFSNFNGYIYAPLDDYYEDCSTTTPFYFYHRTNLRGTFVQRPTEIKKEISYNCALQRIEYEPLWHLLAFEYLPTWKVLDLEQQFMHEILKIDDGVYNRPMIFKSASPFKKLTNCCEVFKLDADFNECIQRQTFGCTTTCGQTTYYYAIPAEGLFYNDSGLLIANDIEGLLLWFNSQNGVVAVSEVDLSCIEVGSPPVPGCNIETLISFQTNGVVPASIYINSLIQPNRIYALQLDDPCDICSILGTTQCLAPETGVVVVDDVECDAPEYDTPTVDDIVPEDLTIDAYGNWVEVSGTAEGFSNSVLFSFNATNNADYTGNPGDDPLALSAIVGYITGNGVPLSDKVITTTDTNATGTVYVIIDTQGFITVSGVYNWSDTNEITIDLQNLTYQL